MELAVVSPDWRLFGVFSPADITVIAVLVFSAGIGFWSGFIWQFVRIASIGVCACVTLLYSPLVAESLDLAYPSSVKLQISAVAVFVTTLTVAYLVAYLLRAIPNAFHPQLTDRFLGAAFGLFKGGLLVASLSLLALTYTGDRSAVREQVEQSRMAATMGDFLQYALPDSMRERIRTPADLEPPSVAVHRQ